MGNSLLTADQLRAWRLRVFYSCCLLYTGYYFCRKDFSKLPGLAVDRGEHMSVVMLPLLCFGVAYSVGQLMNGWLVERIGAVRMMFFGAIVTGLATLVSGFIHADRVLFILLECISGLGQGFGWVSALTLFGAWFQPNERRSVLGWWNGSYILGGLVATSLAGWNVPLWQKTQLQPWSIAPAHLIPAAITLLCAAIFYRTLRRLPSEMDARAALGTAPEKERTPQWKTVLRNNEIRSIATMYFFLKMMRYALLFWLPVYLMNSLGYSAVAAASMAACFELFGAAGSILVVRSAQPWFQLRYFLASACYLAALAFVCLLHPLFSHAGWVSTAFSVSLMGFLIHGVDLLMSGVAVLDLTPPELHSRSVGFVNAVGSTGQTVSVLVVIWMSLTLGWNSLFNLFVICALAAAAVCIREHSLQIQRTTDQTVLNVLTS